MIQVFIPLYNDITYFPRALESVLAQQSVELEVIISDNASTDGSYEYAMQIAAGEPRVKVFRNASNIGAVSNLNRFRDYVTADYYMVLCSDDALGDPRALCKARTILDSDSAIVSVYADMVYIDGKDRKLATRRFRATGVFDAHRALRNSILSYRNCFGIPLLNRRSACADLRYPEQMTYVADVYLSYRAAERGRVFHIAEPLIWNRYTGKNLTASLFSQSTRQFAELIEVLNLPMNARDRLVRAFRLATVIPGKYIFLKFARLRSS